MVPRGMKRLGLAIVVGLAWAGAAAGSVRVNNAGGAEYIEATDDIDLMRNTSACGLYSRIKINTLPAGGRPLLGPWQVASPQSGLFLQIGPVSTGIVYEILVTHDGALNKQKMFINGAQSGSTTTFSGPTRDVAGRMRIGRNTATDYDVQLEELAVWNSYTPTQDDAVVLRNGVKTPGALSTPAGSLTFVWSGAIWTPASATYTISNSSSSTINVSVSAASGHVEADDDAFEVAPSGSHVLTLRPTAAAKNLSAGTHSETVTIDDVTTSYPVTRGVSLTISATTTGHGFSRFIFESSWSR